MPRAAPLPENDSVAITVNLNYSSK